MLARKLCAEIACLGFGHAMTVPRSSVRASALLACVQAIIKTTVGRDLGLLLKHLLGSTNREFFAALQDAGISFSQLKCLGLLSNAEAPLSLGALSEDLGLSLARSEPRGGRPRSAR